MTGTKQVKIKEKVKKREYKVEIMIGGEHYDKTVQAESSSECDE